MANFTLESMENLPSLHDLSEFYLKTQNDLKAVHQTLRSFTTRKNSQESYERTVRYPDFKRNIPTEDECKSENEDKNKSDSADDPDSPNPHQVTVKSVLIPKKNNNKKRKNFSSLHNAKVKSRNCRMFGMLQTTLVKFRNEAARKKSEILKRQGIELKIEKAARKEWEDTRSQKLKEKEEKEKMLKCLEEMMSLLKQHENWKRRHNPKLHFLLTRCKPQIYFLPSRYCALTMKLLNKSKKKVSESIERREQLLNRDLSNIKNAYL